MAPCGLVHSDNYEKDEKRYLDGVPRREDILASVTWGIAKDPQACEVAFSHDGLEIRVIKTASFGDYPAFNFFFRIVSPSECELLAIRPIETYEEEI